MDGLASAQLAEASDHCGSLLRVSIQTGKMGKHFPVREKSGNFEQTGKVRENHIKYWKIQRISDKYYLFFSDI